MPIHGHTPKQRKRIVKKRETTRKQNVAKKAPAKRTKK